MTEIIMEWETIERRRAKLEVPDDATTAQITDLADAEAHKGRAGKLDEMLGTAILGVSWTHPDGRFGGRVR